LQNAIRQYHQRNYEVALNAINEGNHLLGVLAPGNPLSLEFDVIYILSNLEVKRDPERTIFIFLRIANNFGVLAIQTILKHCQVRVFLKYLIKYVVHLFAYSKKSFLEFFITLNYEKSMFFASFYTFSGVRVFSL